MEGVKYNKIEIVVKNYDSKWINCAGTKCVEFINAHYYYVGNNVVVTNYHTIEVGNDVTEERYYEVFSLDNIIKFKCTKNVKKEN